ncbi:MAG TPA: hypothetical protein VKU41_27805, partial [Polyangiaceae bacterium]|nr:hypothetical protein [Polyangiaceae bacterium]
MAHNARINPDLFYVNGTPIPSSYFQALDTAQSKAVNGDAGGTWNPSTPIQIAGQGMWWGLQATLSGGATITTPFGSGKRITLAANDVPLLVDSHAYASRTIATPCAAMADANPSGNSFSVGPFAFGAAIYPCGATAMSPGGGFLCPLRVHDGATFTQAVLNFFVQNTPGRVRPHIFPRMAVFSADAFGNVTLLGASATGGWVTLPDPGSDAAYNGQSLSITYPIAGGGVIIDRSKNVYYAIVADEAGANSQNGNAYNTIVCSFSSI